jgi:hypothetical protein
MVVTAGQHGRDAQAVVLQDTWSLTFGAGSGPGQDPAWTALAPAGEAPPARRSPAHAVRPTEAGPVELLMAAGLDATSATHFNDVWRLHLDTLDGRWERLAVSDCAAPMAPACRRSAAAVYDARHDQLVMVFGRDDATFFGDAAVFDLTASSWRPRGQ